MVDPYDAGQDRLTRVLPHVTVKTLPGQDHAALWMAPEAVVASARRFFLTDDSGPLEESDTRAEV